MFIFIFLCCFLTTERVYCKIREIATFLEALECRWIFTCHAPTNTYRCVEEQLFCIFIAVHRIHLLRLPLYTPFLWVTASIYVDISLAIQTISTNQIASPLRLRHLVNNVEMHMLTLEWR
jgi:hypothetical protein